MFGWGSSPQPLDPERSALTTRPVFFNLGSAEPSGSAKVILGSAKYLNISLFDIDYKHSEFYIIDLPRF
jgi:hypothetical protein